MTKPLKLTAGQVISSLRLRYAAPRWAFLEQVANGTGFGASRWIDGFALSLWPSMGFEAHAIEVKVSRSDWRRELAAPEKMDAIGKQCHRVWLAAPVGVLPVDEVPTMWGILEVEDPTKPPTVVCQAERLAAPEPSWSFVAAILRRASEAAERPTDVVPSDEIDARVEAEIKARIADALQHHDRATQRELASLKTDVQAFQNASGIDITERGVWPHRLGVAVKTVLARGDVDRACAEIAREAKRLRRAADEIEAALAPEPETPAPEAIEARDVDAAGA